MVRLRPFLSSIALLLVVVGGCGPTRAVDGPAAPVPTTALSSRNLGLEYGIDVPTCGPGRAGLVAPVHAVQVRGRFPTPTDIAVPPAQLHYYQTLDPNAVSFQVGGYGGCRGTDEIHPTCTAKVMPDNTILLEADMCFGCEPGRPGPASLVIQSPGAKCSAGALAPGEYTLVFRGDTISTFKVPSVMRTADLGRAYPLPKPPDAGTD